MPRVPRKRSDRSTAHADKRLAEIKEVAARKFFEKGYEGTDLRAIANELGMHAGSLYNYIESKEQILFLIMREALDEWILRLSEAADSEQDPLDRLRGALDAYIKRHVLLKEVTFTSEVEIRALGGRHREEIFDLRRRYESLWIRLVTDCVEAGALRPVDVRMAVYAILSLPWSLPLWFRENGRLTLDQVTAEYLALIFNGLVDTVARGEDGGQPPSRDAPKLTVTEPAGR